MPTKQPTQNESQLRISEIFAELSAAWRKRCEDIVEFAIWGAPKLREAKELGADLRQLEISPTLVRSMLNIAYGRLLPEVFRVYFMRPRMLARVVQDPAGQRAAILKKQKTEPLPQADIEADPGHNRYVVLIGGISGVLTPNRVEAARGDFNA